MQTINQIAEGILDESVQSETLTLAFGDIVTEVRTNSRKLKQQLQSYFSGFVREESQKPHISIVAVESDTPKLNCNFTVKQPDPGKKKIKEEYVDFPDGRMVRKRLTGMIFCFGNGLNLALGPCTENANQVINFINNRYIQWLLNRGFLLGHAAAVEFSNVGIALAGFSGTGKSTFALHLMNSGAKFISNDRLMIKKDDSKVCMIGVAKLPRVNPGTILNNPRLYDIIPESERKEFEKLSSKDLWGLEYKYDVFINEIFGADRFSLFSTMDMLVILNWKQSENPAHIEQIDITSRNDLLETFIKPPGLFYEPEISHPEKAFSKEAYKANLQQCKVFEITGGIDFEKASDTLLAELNNLT
jgi:HprK-related kinase B